MDSYLDQEDRYTEFKKIVTTQRENVRALNAVFRMAVEAMDDGQLNDYQQKTLTNIVDYLQQISFNSLRGQQDDTLKKNIVQYQNNRIRIEYMKYGGFNRFDMFNIYENIYKNVLDLNVLDIIHDDVSDVENDRQIHNYTEDILRIIEIQSSLNTWLIYIENDKQIEDNLKECYAKISEFLTIWYFNGGVKHKKYFRRRIKNITRKISRALLPSSFRKRLRNRRKVVTNTSAIKGGGIWRREKEWNLLQVGKNLVAVSILLMHAYYHIMFLQKLLITHPEMHKRYYMYRNGTNAVRYHFAEVVYEIEHTIFYNELEMLGRVYMIRRSPPVYKFSAADNKLFKQIVNDYSSDNIGDIMNAIYINRCIKVDEEPMTDERKTTMNEIIDEIKTKYFEGGGTEEEFLNFLRNNVVPFMYQYKNQYKNAFNKALQHIFTVSDFQKKMELYRHIRFFLDLRIL